LIELRLSNDSQVLRRFRIYRSLFEINFKRDSPSHPYSMLETEKRGKLRSRCSDLVDLQRERHPAKRHCPCITSPGIPLIHMDIVDSLYRFGIRIKTAKGLDSTVGIGNRAIQKIDNLVMQIIVPVPCREV
jgi:hypothetical protein